MKSAINRKLFAAIGLALLFFSPLAVRPAAADVVGTTYTSPTFGHTITWSNAWFFVDEIVEPSFDILILSDGLSYAQLFSSSALGTMPQWELGGIITGWKDESMSDYQPLLDANGSPIREIDETHATATYTFTQNYDDGSTLDFTIRYEARLLDGNILIMAVFDVPSYAYPGYDAEWSELLDGMVPPGTTQPPPGPEPTQVSEQPLDTSLTAAGPAQGMVSGFWRVSIAGVAVGSEILDLELEVKDGREWLVIIADLTNWSDADAEFTLRDPLVQTAQMSEGWDFAPSSTRQVARLLGLADQGNKSVDVPANGTVRIVLVYSIPAAGTGAELQLFDEVLPIADLFNVAFDPATLPVMADPSFAGFEEGTISGFSGGSVIGVTIAGIETEITLIGANVPVSGDCYALQALAELSQYNGSTVLLESDPALASDTDRYVWIVNPDGTKSLLNQVLIESGNARYSSTPNAARFSAWLQGSEKAAQETGAGLWTTCGV